MEEEFSRLVRFSVMSPETISGIACSYAGNVTFARRKILSKRCSRIVSLVIFWPCFAIFAQSRFTSRGSPVSFWMSELIHAIAITYITFQIRVDKPAGWFGPSRRTRDLSRWGSRSGDLSGRHRARSFLRLPHPQ